jgi:hypothetical protein
MYLYTSYVGGCAGLLYVLIKGRMFHFDPVAWAPAAAMMITFAVFSWLHILAARCGSAGGRGWGGGWGVGGT